MGGWDLEWGWKWTGEGGKRKGGNLRRLRLLCVAGFGYVSLSE